MKQAYLDIESLIKEAKKNEDAFQIVLSKSAHFEIKGIMNSEMLLFVTLIDLLKVKHIIESGRARAQSTEIIARWLARKKGGERFDSIEFDADSEDVEIAEARIQNSGFPVNLHYGDAFELLPMIANETEEEKIILIDGPKGIDAIKLAIDALANNMVKAVCIHDVHKGYQRLRNMVEKHWPIILASDENSYVEAFKRMDNPCWEEHQKYNEFEGWGPYRRGARIMQSYGPTLLCLLNTSISSDNFDEAVEVIKREKSRVDRKRNIARLIGRFVPKRLRRDSRVRKLIRIFVNQ